MGCEAVKEEGRTQMHSGKGVYSFSQLFTHKYWYLTHNDHNM